MADFSAIVDHLTTSGLAIVCLYVIFRQWQSDIRIHQRDDREHQHETDNRIDSLTNAVRGLGVNVGNLGSQVNTLARIVAQHEKDRV
jgi:dissimilatory sulfite reductase (desulfoviridin) alpha/beta subunit